MSGIGAQTLPLPSGGAPNPVEDPLCVKLADYLAFWIRLNLDPGATEARPSEITDPLPVGNVFAFNPRKTWARAEAARPALYVWWPDESDSKYEQYTMFEWVRIRTIHIQYVMAEVQYPSGARIYSGLTQAVDATIAQALRASYHPSYDSGTSIGESLSVEGGVELMYEGGQSIFSLVRQDPGSRPQSETKVHRGFPVYIGKIRVKELLSDIEVAPPETLVAMDLDMYVEPSDPLLVLQRTIEE